MSVLWGKDGNRCLEKNREKLRPFGCGAFIIHKTISAKSVQSFRVLLTWYRQNRVFVFNVAGYDVMYVTFAINCRSANGYTDHLWALKSIVFKRTAALTLLLKAIWYFLYVRKNRLCWPKTKRSIAYYHNHRK